MNDSQLPSPRSEKGRAGRIGRAGAWFAAGALGATALTSVAFANVAAQDEGTDEEGKTERKGPGGKGNRGPGHHKGPGGMGKNMLHSEGVIESEDGKYTEVATQKGTVNDVSETSITVTSKDGYAGTYTINGDTKVHRDREQKAITDVKADDTVRIMPFKEGDNLIAKHVGALSPEKAVEVEKKREEMKKRFEERKAERENQTTESGWQGWGGPEVTEAGLTL